MNDSDLVATVRKAHDDLSRLLAAFELADARDGLTIIQRIRQSFNGWPRSSGFGGTTARSATDQDGEPLPGISDPTGEAAMRQDRAAEDQKSLVKEAVKITQAIDRMFRTSAHYTLRTAGGQEQHHVEISIEPGCDSCARVPSPGTVGKTRNQQSPWFNRVDLITTLANEAPVSLCDWCWRGPVGVKFTGELPPERAVADHRDGKRFRATA